MSRGRPLRLPGPRHQPALHRSASRRECQPRCRVVALREDTRMLRLGIACVGLFVLTSGAMATEITPAVRSELAPTGKLRIGLNHGNFLLVTPGSSGTDPRGVASDLGRELGRRLGVPVEFIRFDTAGKLGDAVRTGAWDVAFLGAEPQRAADIAFTAAYLEIPATYIVPAGSPIRSVADVDREGVRIAVTEQSAYGLFLSRSVKHARLVLTKGPALEVFVAEKKASGLVAEAISRNGVQGVSVAPPAPQ